MSAVAFTKVAGLEHVFDLARKGTFKPANGLASADWDVYQYCLWYVVANDTDELTCGQVLPSATSPKAIARRTGRSGREIRRSLQRLSAAGLLKVSWQGAKYQKVQEIRVPDLDGIVARYDQTAKPFRKTGQYCKLVAELVGWTITLTERGEFAGRVPARRIKLWLDARTAVKNGRDGNFGCGEVLPGSIRQRTIAARTGLSGSTISQSQAWLHEEGFICVWAEEDSHGITVMTIDEDSERKRKSSLPTPKSDESDHVSDESDQESDDSDHIDRGLVKVGIRLQPEDDLGELSGIGARPSGEAPDHELAKEIRVKIKRNLPSLARILRDKSLAIEYDPVPGYEIGTLRNLCRYLNDEIQGGCLDGDLHDQGMRLWEGLSRLLRRAESEVNPQGVSTWLAGNAAPSAQHTRQVRRSA